MIKHVSETANWEKLGFFQVCFNKKSESLQTVGHHSRSKNCKLSDVQLVCLVTHVRMSSDLRPQNCF